MNQLHTTQLQVITFREMSFFRSALDERVCVSLCDDCYRDAQKMYVMTICASEECICDQSAFQRVSVDCDRCQLPEAAGCPAHHLTQVLISWEK